MRGSRLPRPLTIREPSPLLFAVTRGEQATSVVVQGELDHFSSARLPALVTALLADRPARIVIDLTGVTFFCAAAIRALLLTRMAVRAHGAELVLRALSPIARHVLSATGDLDQFDVETEI